METLSKEHHELAVSSCRLRLEVTLLQYHAALSAFVSALAQIDTGHRSLSLVTAGAPRE